MKANELMLDDWVQGFVPDTYSRIVGILNDFRVGINTEPGKVYMELPVENLQPISLTGEVLEKNGWYIPDLYLWYRHDSVPFLISERGGGFFCLYADSEHDKREFFCSIKYVHELQHVLRLCGIEKEVTL